MSFKENLRNALAYSGMEQKELARKAEISLRNIENYLSEYASVPVADKAVKIARALGVTVEYLVTGENLPLTAPASISPELQELILSINKLHKNKQRIVIQNAVNLAKIL